MDLFVQLAAVGVLSVFFFVSDHHLSLTSNLLFLANAKGDICTVCFYSGSPSERGYLYSVFLFRQPMRKELSVQYVFIQVAKVKGDVSVQYVFIQVAKAKGDICTVCFYSGSQSERGCVCTICFYSGSQSERGYLYSMFLFR